MGYDCSYEYTKVRFHVDECGILLGDFKFVDEHGHPLKSVKNVLLYVNDDSICLTDGELCVPDREYSSEYWLKAREKYGKNYPNYDVYNDEDLYKEYIRLRDYFLKYPYGMVSQDADEGYEN